MQSISFLGIELDSVTMTACLPEDIQGKNNGSTEKNSVDSEVASSAAVMLLKLMNMRHDTHRVAIKPNLSWLIQHLDRPCISTGRGSLRKSVQVLLSKTGWGALCNGHAALSSWIEPQLQWNINCLELLAILLALWRF